MSRNDPSRSKLAAAPPPVPADVGIVAALPIEIGPLLARFREVRKYAAKGQTIVEGQLAGKVVAIVQTGPGRVRAQRGAERLIDGHRPRWIVSAGFAGGLDPAIPRYSVVYPIEVANVEGRIFPTDWPVDLASATIGARGWRLLTTDEVVLKAIEKAKLREAHQADLVDMETSSVAALCGERGVKFLSLRVVSDDATADLPSEILSIMGESGSYRIGAAVGAIWRRPGSLKEMLALRDQAIEAAARLARAVLEIVPKL